MDRWASGDYALNKAVLDCVMALLVIEQRSRRPLRHQTRFVRRHRLSWPFVGDDRMFARSVDKRLVEDPTGD